MAPHVSHGSGRRLEQLRIRVQSWREVRPKRRPMPAELWEEAASLARELGVNRVRPEVGLDYGSLRRRVAAEAQATEGTKFLELPSVAPQVERAGGACAIEIERPD